MSLSTLGQQLAAINGPRKNTGSNFSTSRRHEDAIGRGLSHSVQVGHALHNNDHKYKPSIIHEDARKSSDVPLATIRENCITSLRHLETIDTEFGAFVETLCQNDAKERGLLSATENNKIDKCIEDLLYRISLVMDHRHKSNLAFCLNVIEFMLRKYEIHLRPKSASALLLSMLPHHEEPYFLRILQLIDLANLPEWSFLRPYALSGVRLSRSILAKTASKDITLIRSICHLSEYNSKMPFAQHSLSFTAAVLVEALTLQTQRKGSMEERTCQAILPFVVAACRNEKYYKGLLNGKKHSEGFDGSMWQNWGYVVASTMVETGIFAPEPRSLLVKSVLHGLALQQESVATSIEKHGLSNSSERRKDWNDVLKSISSGLIVSLTILSQTITGPSTLDKSEWKDSSYLPLLSPSMTTSSDSANLSYRCGFSMMDKDIFNALLKLDEYDNEGNSTDHNKDTKSKNIRNSSKSSVVACISNIYHQDGIVDSEQWVACLLVFGWKRLVKYHKHTSDQTYKRNRKSRTTCCKILNLVLNLVKHPHLETLWKKMDGQWIESFISFVYLNTPIRLFDAVKNDVNDAKASHFSEDEYMTSILQTLQTLDKKAYEKGITHALMQTKNNKDRISLAKHLGLSNPKSGCVEATSEENNTWSRGTINLPPSVGLEHADYRIRLGSINALLDEAKGEDSCIGTDTKPKEETTSQSLFRRFLVDDSKQVAIAAAKALQELLCLREERIMSDIGCMEMSEGTLQAFYKWFQSPSDDEKLKEELLTQSCRFAAYAVKALRELNQKDVIFFRLLEGLGALLSDRDSTVSLEASKGIMAAFDQGYGSIKASEIKKLAKHFLISDKTTLNGFSRAFHERNSIEFHFRRQLCGKVLEAICTAEPCKKIPKELLEYTIWMIEVFGNDFDEAEVKALGKSLEILSDRFTIDLGRIHSTFCRLSSSSGSLFDTAVVPYIHATCEKIRDNQGGRVSPVAILMEIILSSDSSIQIKNLLSVASEMISKDMIGMYYAIVPTLALCCHQEEYIRRLSISYLFQILKEFQNVTKKEDWMVLIPVCKSFSENKTSVVLKGASFLSEFLTTILSNSDDASSIRKYLLQAILCSVTAYGAMDSVSSTDYFAKSWLRSCNLVGGYKAGCTLLAVTESAGEAAFSLMSRWEGVGQPLLSAMLSRPCSMRDKVSYHQSQLIHSIVKILRGSTISPPSYCGTTCTSTIITIGPSPHGRRARSYSFGKNDGNGSLQPYPISMQNSIISILTKTTTIFLHKEIQSSLFDNVLCSHTWRKNVFCHLNGKVRQKIASVMLIAATESLFHDIDSVILSLPLDANDIASLLCGQENNEFGLSKLTFISDYISTNPSKLAMSQGVNELFESIFMKLADFDELTEIFEAVEFARHALLCALLELIKSSLDLGSMMSNLGTKKKTFDSWLNTLQSTVVKKRASRNHFVPIRSKRIIFLIFAFLCDKNPKIVIPKLIPIITGIATESLSYGEQTTVIECFDLVIPIYFKHASDCNISPTDLFRAFINHVLSYDENVRPKYYTAFIHALSMIPKNSDSEASPIGSFIAAVLAREGYCSSEETSIELLYSKLPALAAQILPRSSSDARIQALWTIQNYAKEILFVMLQEEIPNGSDSVFPVEYLIELAVKGPDSTGEISSNQSLSDVASSLSSLSVLDSLSSLLIIVTCEIVTSNESRNMIERTDGSSSMVILRLWQDLLLIKSACQNRLGGSNNNDKSEFLERIIEITTQALECIQSNLPSHIFFAFVTNLVTVGETEELRARAVQLIAERSASSYLGKSETILFVETIPPLLQLLEPIISEDKNQRSSGKYLRQSVFSAIDSIGRNTCLSCELDVSDRQLQIFSDVTFKAALVVGRENQSSNFLNIPTESRQLISSVALCISTAIKICGPRALPVLPKLVKPSLDILDCASTFIESSTSVGKTVDKNELSQAKLMQLAIIRSVRSIIEEMPKLLKPYLVDICRAFSKIYASFRSDSSNQSQPIQMVMVSLRRTISSLIPSRQFIPAASNSIFSTSNIDLSLPTISTMIECIKNSKSSEVSGMIGLITKTTTYMFDQNASQEVMQAADNLLLCLVMKLSEMQLRSLYRNIREWRGNLDKSNPEETGARRSAFWRFSAALSKQLKSIYLSCFTSVFSDVVDELEMAALYLSKMNSVKNSNGKKKQRLSSSEEKAAFQYSSLQALRNLLLCLEVSLRSDAHEGGVWIRELESQRYEKLLEPLGKLLFCQLPFNRSDITFETLVKGNEPLSGSVVECLVALATAAGDEQLWKPLNHCVVQACSDKNRLEVRKVGVSCLLSLINSIGEEYMVLIPECLPILSELLEDPDEEVAAAAHECISQSEDLLGESLQDSLR